MNQVFSIKIAAIDKRSYVQIKKWPEKKRKGRRDSIDMWKFKPEVSPESDIIYQCDRE